MQIGFAGQNPTSHYWLIVSHGVRERATELGIALTTTHASTLHQQTAALHQLIDQRVDVILLGPVAAHGLAAPIRRAQAAGIPVIVLAAGVSDCAVTATVRSDHRTGAEVAARYLVEQLGGRGAVAHLMGPSQLQDNLDRAAGVRHVLAQQPDVTIVFEQESPDWRPESGAALMHAALTRFPHIRGVCCANDTLALGASTAIGALGRTGGIVVTGFDATPDALLAIHRGQMSATVQQQIRGIGRAGVEMAQQVAAGAAVPPLVLTDIALITRATLLDATLDAVDLLPTVLRDFITNHERQWRLQEQVIATQRQLIDELTTRKQVEEAIQFQARLLDAVEEAVIAVDSAGTIIYWNRVAAFLYGWPTDEVIGQNFDLIFGADPPEHLRALTVRLCEGAAWSGEVEVRRRDGTVFPVLMTNSPISDQGRRMGSVSVSIDITERKRAEDERLAFERNLLETQKLESLGVLAGGIAHDFNNLLMTILGNAGLALMELPPEAPARASITQIELAVKHAADLTRQLLAYAGKGRFIIQKLNLNALIEEMMHLLQVSIPKTVALRYQLAPHLPPVEADAAQIRQVVMNLVINAAQAIGDKQGSISISTGVQFADQAYLSEAYLAPHLPEGQYVFLEVADTGSGMDADTRAKIFEPFFTTKATGRGLGLAAVLGIVRGHNGALGVYSAPGQGSTFKFLLPAAASPAYAETPRNQHAGAWHVTGTVLVVDDEATIRSVATRMLEKLGFKVLVAEDGAVGVDLFREHAPTIVCVLLDMTMPNLDGVATFRALRRIKRDVQVILMSGYNEQDVTSQFAGKGLAGFLSKPFTVEDLRQKLQHVCQVEMPHTPHEPS